MAYTPQRTKEITARMKAAITASRRSETSLAHDTRIPLTTLRRYIAGDKSWDTEKIDRVASVLNRDPYELMIPRDVLQTLAKRGEDS